MGQVTALAGRPAGEAEIGLCGHLAPQQPAPSHTLALVPCPLPSYCRLVVAEGGEDVTIKVSDEGGGIPRSGLPRIWTYLYSTAKHTVAMEGVDEAGEGPVVLAGYGYGLPISRLYARWVATIV